MSKSRPMQEIIAEYGNTCAQVGDMEFTKKQIDVNMSLLYAKLDKLKAELEKARRDEARAAELARQNVGGPPTDVTGVQDAAVATLVGDPAPVQEAANG